MLEMASSHWPVHEYGRERVTTLAQALPVLLDCSLLGFKLTIDDVSWIWPAQAHCASWLKPLHAAAACEWPEPPCLLPLPTTYYLLPTCYVLLPITTVATND